MTERLHHLLQALADEGADSVTVDEPSLVPRIRRRRRRRIALTGVAGVASTAAIAVAAYAVLPSTGPAGSGPPVAGSVATTPPPKPPSTAKPLDCGMRPDKGFLPTPPSGLEGLRLTTQGFTKTATGWTGEVHFEGTRAIAWIGSPIKFNVYQDNQMIARATAKITKSKRNADATVVIYNCKGMSVNGTVLLDGKLFPGQHPITSFEVKLGW
jgi:hypothetical protein